MTPAPLADTADALGEIAARVLRLADGPNRALVAAEMRRLLAISRGLRGLDAGEVSGVATGQGTVPGVPELVRLGPVPLVVYRGGVA